jgi:hypothetical protein
MGALRAGPAGLALGRHGRPGHRLPTAQDIAWWSLPSTPVASCASPTQVYYWTRPHPAEAATARRQPRAASGLAVGRDPVARRRRSPRDGRRVRRIRHKTDGGQLGAPAREPDAYTASVATHPTRHRPRRHRGGVFRSTNGGKTWPPDRYATVAELVNVTVKHPSLRSSSRGPRAMGVGVEDGGSFTPHHRFRTSTSTRSPFEPDCHRVRGDRRRSSVGQPATAGRPRHWRGHTHDDNDAPPAALGHAARASPTPRRRGRLRFTAAAPASLD